MAVQCFVPGLRAEQTPALQILVEAGLGKLPLRFQRPLGRQSRLEAAAVQQCQPHLRMAGVVAQHPKRFGAFATLPLADTQASLVEMRHALDTLKMDGVCLLTNVDGLYLGEPRFEPIFAELNRRANQLARQLRAHGIGPESCVGVLVDRSPSLAVAILGRQRAVRVATPGTLPGVGAGHPRYEERKVRGHGLQEVLIVCAGCGLGVKGDG